MPRRVAMPQITGKEREAMKATLRFQVHQPVKIKTGELFMSCIEADAEGDAYWNQMPYLREKRQEVLDWCRLNCESPFALTKPVQPMRMTTPGESFDDLLNDQHSNGNRPCMVYTGFFDKGEMMLASLMFPEITVNVYWRSYLDFTLYFPKALIEELDSKQE